MTTSPAHWLSEQQRLGRDLYLILDPLAEAELRASRPASGTSLNLYEGSEVSHLAAIGPRLLGVEDAEADWLRAWLTQPERNWGWLLSAKPLDLQRLAGHWTQRSVVREQGRRVLYRFQDNRVIARHLQALEPEQRPLLLGPVASGLAWDGQRWQRFDNPAPGHYPVPGDAPWLQLPEPGAVAQAIRRHNLEQWLWQSHCAALCRLLEKRDLVSWLDEQLAQADTWGWHTNEAVKFLLAHQLQPAWAGHAAWSPREGELPEAHLARCRRTFSEAMA